MSDLKEDVHVRRTTGSANASGRIARLLWTIAGTVSLALGLIGIALPIVPTTPFLLLAAACYLKGSEKMYKWMTENRWFGRYLRDYMEGKGIPLRTKIAALSMLWLAIGFSIVFVTENLIVRLILIIVALGVTAHIATIRTSEKVSEKVDRSSGEDDCIAKKASGK